MLKYEPAIFCVCGHTVVQDELLLLLLLLLLPLLLLLHDAKCHRGASGTSTVFLMP